MPLEPSSSQKPLQRVPHGHSCRLGIRVGQLTDGPGGLALSQRRQHSLRYAVGALVRSSSTIPVLVTTTWGHLKVCALNNANSDKCRTRVSNGLVAARCGPLPEVEETFVWALIERPVWSLDDPEQTLRRCSCCTALGSAIRFRVLFDGWPQSAR